MEKVGFNAKSRCERYPSMILHGSHMADTREFAQQIVQEILSQSVTVALMTTCAYRNCRKSTPANNFFAI